VPSNSPSVLVPMEPGCPVLSPGDSGCYLLSSVLASFAVSLWLRVSLFLTKDSDVNDSLINQLSTVVPR
jgi:hypothetical protein